MGSANSALIGTNVSLQFSEQTKKFYQTNEIVSGTIECYHNGDSDVTLKSVSVELIGELVYSIDESSSKQRSPTTHGIPFFTKILTLRDTDDQKQFILTPGTHIWPFSFHLDDSLPPTMTQNHHQGPYIRYFLCVRLKQSDWYKMNVEQRYPIIIQRSTTSLRVTDLAVQNENRKGVKLHALLHKNVAVAGECFSFEVDLYNPNQMTIHRISAKLIQEQILGLRKDKNVIPLTKNLLDVYGFQDKHLCVNCELFLPKITVASFSWETEPWPSRNTLIVRYSLYLEAHMHGPFNNIRLQFPLIIINTTPTNEDELMPPPSYETLFPV
ncbi:unnamed protein product [Rotaria sp. Silwood1]|nr:unnamed protein product [Rotaria sp. Silwood1]CAF3909933.1 unnamed protein product [Rotaria sp. Silwood1]CAF4969471.1 unnamed protein product [Rotaria sp. Silwood1]CAF5028531.1 unnamed protein product [Rotaria sp. Silwood1]